MKKVLGVECRECHETFSDKANIDSILSFDNDGLCKACTEIYYQAADWKKNNGDDNYFVETSPILF